MFSGFLCMLLCQAGLHALHLRNFVRYAINGDNPLFQPVKFGNLGFSSLCKVGRSVPLITELLQSSPMLAFELIEAFHRLRELAAAIGQFLGRVRTEAVTEPSRSSLVLVTCQPPGVDGNSLLDRSTA